MSGSRIHCYAECLPFYYQAGVTLNDCSADDIENLRKELRKKSQTYENVHYIAATYNAELDRRITVFDFLNGEDVSP